ncbi:MAG: hypothetical protein ACRED2_06930, partial [Methylocella sp.]
AERMHDNNRIMVYVAAAAAAVCCAGPVVVAVIGTAGLTTWLAKAGNVLVPALILCTVVAGFVLYRKRHRER